MKNAPTAHEESRLTDDQLNLVVCKLRQITRESTLDYAIRIGSVIIHYFYQGDMKVWRKRGPKTQSFRRLARHPELPMSASALYRCVAIFELCDRVDVVSRWSRITVSHLKVVLPLSEQEQCRLIAAAHCERWSVQRLELEARRAESNPSGRRGRAATRGVGRVASSVGKLLQSSELVLERLPELEAMLSNEANAHYARAQQSIHEAIRHLEEARDALARLRLDETGSAPALEAPSECHESSTRLSVVAVS